MNRKFENVKPAIKLPSGYALNETFSDDFRGRSLDFSKWYPFYPGWDGRKDGWFNPDNVSVSNGSLRLFARYVRTVPPQLAARDFANLTTACVRSRTRVLYGCFQVSFRSMDAAICNAFWLSDPLDPPQKFRPGFFSDEIDMFEVFGKSTLDQHNRYFTTCHRLATPYLEGLVYSGNTKFTRPATPKEPFLFSAAFHTGTFLWEPDRLRWYLDGRLVFDHPNDYYHSPMYLNIDCEPMRAWCGPVDPGDLPAVYTLRHLRLWQPGAESKEKA